ncbi:unnamed protein product [Clonostachys chloroleuca]|uniref:C2H2-type zinc finger ascomycetes domain-containing protein n=1 Tax=Clonostachys chloroleuca TaxID=1926264 RepID=A0AA35LQ15_9HYPO|nr:unnamed protein product [Clonostachys chloroleuca]
MQKPGLKMQAFFMCGCCPKKSRKFETVKALSFKNKNEAERPRTLYMFDATPGRVRHYVTTSLLSTNRLIDLRKLTPVAIVVKTSLDLDAVQLAMADTPQREIGRSDQDMCKTLINL